jgi:hypothetical protein
MRYEKKRRPPEAGQMDPASEGFNNFRIKMTANNLGMKATDQKVDNLAAIFADRNTAVMTAGTSRINCFLNL